MFCSNCGKEVSEGEKFCSDCGKPLQPQQTDSVEQFKMRISPSKNSPVIICLCVVIAVLVLGLVGVSVAGFVSDKSDGSAAEVTASDKSEEEAGEKETGEKEAVEEVASTTETADTTTKKAETAITVSTVKPTDSRGIVEPDYAMLGNTYYVEPKEGLYLRKGPGKNYDKITLLDRGVGMQMEGERSDSPGWYYVRLFNGTTYGWVSSEYLSTVNPDSNLINKYYSYKTSFTTVVNDRAGLNLRAGASKNSKKYGTIPYGRTLTVIGYSAYDYNWIYVSVYLDGRTQYGFVDSSYVQH